MSEFDLFGQLEASLGAAKVPITEFAQSPKYCNKRLYPRQKLLLKLFFLEELTDAEEGILDQWIAGGRGGNEIIISPHIRERMDYLRSNGYGHFREVVLVGGRRCSKGFMTGVSMAYKMYNTMLLQDPGLHYGIDADKEIYFSVLATSQLQAKQMQYADFSSTVNSCAAMAPHIAKMQALEFSVRTEADERKRALWKRQGRRVEKDTAKLRGAALPANSRSIRGSATMMYCFDEMAHFMQGESDQSDSEVYAAAVPSLAQFGRDAMMFCNSSPYSKVGTFYERWEEGMTTDNGGAANPLMLTVQFPSWALYEGWWEDDDAVRAGISKCITVSPDWEESLKDDEGNDFYSPEDQQAIVAARLEEKSNPDKYKVERRGKFAEVADAYLDPTLVERMFRGRPIPGGVEPLISAATEDVSYEKRYKMHLDPSSTTAGFGFAIAHTEFIEIDGHAQEHVVFDLIKRWLPHRDFPDTGVIDWEVIMSELERYVEIYTPYEVTFDQFQSNAPIQFLRKAVRKMGKSTRVYEKTATAGHNWHRAETFKTALYQNLVHAPYDTEDNRFSALELKFLQEIRTGQIPRVVKQDVGPVQTKDMADCIMECVEGLIGNLVARDEREGLGKSEMRTGALGGYPIGGPDRGGKGESPFGDLYSRRTGEQSGGSAQQGRKSGGSPSRAWGARPSRRMPGW